MREHCVHARFVWNLACEQQSWWRPGRAIAPGYLQQCRQLTAARREHAWLGDGSQMVQQQALRDFDRAMQYFFAGTRRKPTWRKAGRNEGFRVVAVKPQHVRRLNRRIGEVFVPKCGWIRFVWSRAVPDGVKSFRVTLDRAGRWHVAFAAIPQPIEGPGTGEIIGVDRGVAVSAAMSNGELLRCPQLSVPRQRRLRLLERRLARAHYGSQRRTKTRLAVARLKTRQADARKDWCERVSTDLVRRFDLIRVERLRIKGMTRSAKGTTRNPGHNVRQKAGLNREILASGWGLLVRRLDEKAPGRVQVLNPAFTSQRCSCCGHVDRKSRESQAVFRCTACTFTCNADVNAARNLAAGHAVTARGGDGVAQPMNREPQHRGLWVA
jgi:putative transposase